MTCDVGEAMEGLEKEAQPHSPTLTSLLNNIKIGTYQFERVEEFKYLGSLVTEDNMTSKEVNERIKA